MRIDITCSNVTVEGGIGIVVNDWILGRWFVTAVNHVTPKCTFSVAVCFTNATSVSFLLFSFFGMLCHCVELRCPQVSCGV